MAESEKFRRHLGALLHKNALLKRRHPCSLCCEMLLAVGATGLLVMARVLTQNIKSFEIPAQVHVDNSLPVRLPECAEYLAECNVRLVESEPHSAVCVKGITFGCKAPRDTTGRGKAVPGVWVGFGCNGTFDLGGGLPHVHCHPGKMGKPHVCHAAGHEPTPDQCDGNPRENMCHAGGFAPGPDACEANGCCWKPSGPGSPTCWEKVMTVTVDEAPSPRRLRMKPLDSQALIGAAMQGANVPGMRRLDAEFGIAPRRGGGEEFQKWLKERGHPWASHVRLFDTAEDLQAHVSARGYPVRNMSANTSTLICGAVIFETPPQSDDVRYTLRFNASLGYDPNIPSVARMFSSMKIQTDSLVDKVEMQAPKQFSPAGITWYTQTGFLALQRTVDTFLEQVAKGVHPGNHSTDAGGLFGAAARAGAAWLGEDGRPHIIVPFPTEAWQRDIFAMLMPQTLASFLLISLAYSVSRMITAVVHEREARLRDGMRMMGMHTAAFYFSWILTYMAIYTFVSLGVVACLSVGDILPHSSISLLFTWLMLFAAASISYALVITTFFNKAKTAATIGSVAFYASSYLVHLAQPSSSPRYLKLLSVVPPVCFELAARVFADMESQGVGINWDNAGLTSAHFSVQDGCCMLAADAVILLVLFLYLDQVVPREVGLQRPWYFPLQISFWRELFSGLSSPKTAATAPSGQPTAEVEGAERSALVEQEVGEAAAAMARNGQTVELRGLCKSFGELQAVRKLDLVMFQGEIFALLGHNGAGKTTTLAMLCGLMPPTQGSCVVFGHDLAEEPGEVQRLLGVCPQHDVLWEELSCEEHLTLFAGFKGVEKGDVAKEVAAMLQRTGLAAAGASARFAGKLSGGMKRKLSLGIAFLGGSRLVVLDEPTSGLDPYSRRMVWELLRAMKQSRVIVLSTHYMDEADILGDRIAILHEGRLMCCGSPQFLKRAYDCGYNVTFVKRPGCETDAVREAVCRHVPELASEVATLSESAKELILQFPFAAAKHFPQVLGGLEQQMEELNLESYGVSVTTLEEVFLKVASGERVERKEVITTTPDSGSESDRASSYVELQEMPPSDQRQRELHLLSPTRGILGVRATQADATVPASGKWLACKQLQALLQKRWRYGLRDRKGLLCQLFLPSVTLLVLMMLMSAKLFYSMPPLELHAEHYNEHCTTGPQNLVDYSHLASVQQEEAEAILAPGRSWWKGDLRHFPPQDVGEQGQVEEKLVTSRLPGFLENVLRPALHSMSGKNNSKARGQVEALEKEAMQKILPGLLNEGMRPLLKQNGLLPLIAQQRRLQAVPADKADISVLEELLGARLSGVVQNLWAAEQQVKFAAEAAVKAASPLDGSELAKLAQHLHESYSAADLPSLASWLQTEAEESSEPRRLQADFQNSRVPKVRHRGFSQGFAQGFPGFGNAFGGSQRLHGFGRQVPDNRQGEPMLFPPDSMGVASEPMPGTDQEQPIPGLRPVQPGDERDIERLARGAGEPFEHIIPGACRGASSIERALWDSADRDRNGFLTRSEVKRAVKLWVQRADAMKPGRVGSRRRREAEEKLDELLQELAFMALDGDKDSVIAQEEFCHSGAVFRAEIWRWYGLATHFSQQLLNASSDCTRYGAYFVLSAARGPGVPEWAAGADAVIFVNTSSSHSAPVFQAALTNARLARLGHRKRVAVKVHPLPQTKDEQHNLEKIAVFLLAIYITFCLSFIPSGIAHFVVKERQSGARQLQVLSGASHFSYWVSNLTYDVALYVVPAACVPLALKQFGFDMILAGECGRCLLTVLATFGPAVAGFSYLVSFVFKDHSKASNAILSFCLVGASVLSTILFILAIINYNPMSEYPSACDHPTKAFPEGNCVSPNARKADKILGPLFRLVPTVCVYQALFSIALMANLQTVIPQGAMEAMMSLAGDAAPKISLSPWAYEWAGEPLSFLCVESVLYFFLAVFLDWAMHSPRVARFLDAPSWAPYISIKGRFFLRQRDVPLIEPEAEAGDRPGSKLGDDSVEGERERAAHLSPQDVALHMWALEKTYQPWLSLLLPRRSTSGTKKAVKTASLAVHSGEVFGLLGHNGAGKTSALKCIVGELCCTSGRVHVGGFDMEKEASRARRCVGYCPQFDALLELLTVQDHLDLFAAMKGLPREAAAQARQAFHLEKMGHRRAELLSGGNKRKLSAAVALIGSPCLAVLDEPSCGLDPAARRALWTAVHAAVAGATASAVLLTTHSMEEAEALSTRLGIMAEGQLLTVGTAQQIKQRFGGTHELCLTLQPESEQLLAATLNHFGAGALAPNTPLDYRCLGPLLEQDALKKQAYARQRCIVRAQVEAAGFVEASVLAEWWLQQSRGEAIEQFLKSLVGDGVELAENFGAFWRFCLPHGGVGLPELFRQLEEKGGELGIAEYTLTQATLEQIFNSIAHDAQEQGA